MINSCHTADMDWMGNGVDIHHDTTVRDKHQASNKAIACFVVIPCQAAANRESRHFDATFDHWLALKPRGECRELSATLW